MQDKSNEVLVRLGDQIVDSNEKVNQIYENIEYYQTSLNQMDMNTSKKYEEIGKTYKELSSKLESMENTKGEMKETKKHEAQSNQHELLEKIESMVSEQNDKDHTISSLLTQISLKDELIMKKDTDLDQSIMMSQRDITKTSNSEERLNKDLYAIKITLLRQNKYAESLSYELMLIKQLGIRKRMIKLQYDYGAIHNDTVSDFAFSPDEKYAFSVGYDRKLVHYNIQKIHKSFDTGPVHNDKIFFFGITQDGNNGFTVSRDRRMKQFNIPLQCADKQIKTKFDWGAIHQGFINDAAISSCSRFIYTVSSDLSVKEWNIVTNSLESEWQKVDTHPIVKICYCNNINGKYFFIINDQGCIKQFDVATKANILTLDNLGEKNPNAFVMTPNGKYIIIGYANGNVITWNVDKKCIDLKWGVLTKGLTSIAVTPCGSFFFTGGADGTLKMWNLIEKRCHKDYEKVHTGAVTALGVSPNGNFLLTGGQDKRVKQYQIIDQI